jgi:hypothetical protein
MWDYIVLGQIPGTDLRIGFYTFVMMLAALSISGVRLNFKHHYYRKRRSRRAAEVAVASSVLRPDPEPIQLQLFN